jgi:hypothetical protein
MPTAPGSAEGPPASKHSKIAALSNHTTASQRLLFPKETRRFQRCRCSGAATRSAFDVERAHQIDTSLDVTRGLENSRNRAAAFRRLIERGSMASSVSSRRQK